MHCMIFALVFTIHEAPMYSIMSWYGEPFHGRTTASGAVYDMKDISCAHRYLPFGTPVDFYYQGRVVEDVPVTDRGPFDDSREWDASMALFYRLTDGDLDAGLIEVGYVIRD